MDLGLKGRNALVAAASKGLGKAVALELAAEGASVSICARSAAELMAAADEISAATSARVLPFVCDVTSPEQIVAWLEHAEAQLGSIDVLVNNAGGPPTGPFLDFDDEAWRAGLDLNLMSAVRLCRAVLPDMAKRGWGRIVNITSVMVKQPGPGFVLSTSARSAIIGLAKTLSTDYAPRGITINNVCPGYTRTQRVVDLVASRAEREGRAPAEVAEAITSSIPAGRMGEPDELAALVAFLASERAAYITGTTIQVDGGYTKALM
jgi:3-oxoacyl-[acyl-carrier protein] reductase